METESPRVENAVWNSGYDALQALHATSDRARWLRKQVRLHVLDRGTQGDPTLAWCLVHGVPYLTLTQRSANWRRFRHPVSETASGVPIFVRKDHRLAEVSPVEPAQPPTLVIFPARPDRGRSEARALRYRTAAALDSEEVRTMDTVYKERWSANENPIKALIAAGFDRNLDRTLDATTSRGHDGTRAKLLAKVEAARVAAAKHDGNAPTRVEQKRYATTVRRRIKAESKVAAHEAHPSTKGARSARGAEPLCKILQLLLYNALAWMLSKSPLQAIREMTPARVRALLLGCSATGCIEPGSMTLWIDATPSSDDRLLQFELLRLVNDACLRTPHGVLRIKPRDSPRG